MKVFWLRFFFSNGQRIQVTSLAKIKYITVTLCKLSFITTYIFQHASQKYDKTNLSLHVFQTLPSHALTYTFDSFSPWFTIHHLLLCTVLAYAWTLIHDQGVWCELCHPQWSVAFCSPRQWEIITIWVSVFFFSLCLVMYRHCFRLHGWHGQVFIW